MLLAAAAGYAAAYVLLMWFAGLHREEREKIKEMIRGPLRRKK